MSTRNDYTEVMSRSDSGWSRYGYPTAEEKVGETFELTPSQYRAIPAWVTTRRYMQEPAFKRAVDELVKRGLI